MSRKRQQFYIGAIQSEQLKLVKIQDSLESLIHRVNESINALKVEELQLRSSAVDAMHTKSAQQCSTYVATEPISSTLSAFQLHDHSNIVAENFETNKIENVNKQEIDLEVCTRPFGSDLDLEEDD